MLRLAGDGGNLCLGGGVAWNALLVSALERSGRFKASSRSPPRATRARRIGAALTSGTICWATTSAFDGGGYCLGPALPRPRNQAGAGELQAALPRICHDRRRLIGAAVEQLKDNRIVAWMQGRMEFGPRALGNRSILASPRDPYSTENLNAFIKHREPLRKFAASVPAELASEYFEAGPNARHLATVSRVRPQYKEQFRGAILANDLVRVHTVSRDDNPLYWQLLHAFGRKTGLPVLYNTSFNLFGEPLVCTPRDAVRSFYSSGIDAMVVGNFLLEK